MEKSTKQIIGALSVLALGIAIYKYADVPKKMKDGRISEGAYIRRKLGGGLIMIIGFSYAVAPLIKIKGWK